MECPGIVTYFALGGRAFPRQRVGMKGLLMAVALALIASPVAGAKTVNLDGEGASVVLPDTWAVKAQPASGTSTTSSVILSAINPEKSSMLQVLVCANPHGLQASQTELIANIKDNLSNQTLSHGGQIQFTDEGKLSLNDVPAYVVQYKATMTSGPPILGRNYQVAGNGKIYILALRTVDNMGDVDLQTIAGSFHFDSPPVLPVPEAPKHRLRYYLAAAAGVLLLIGLGVGYYYYRQRQLYE
jgi:hypothetical protein